MPLRFNHGFAVVMGPDGSLHYVPTPRNVQGIVTSRGASHVTLSFDQQFRQEFAMMEDRLREMEKINKKQQRKLVRYKQYKLQPVSESAQAKRLETENKQLQRTIRKLQTEISKLTSNAQTTYYQQTPATPARSRARSTKPARSRARSTAKSPKPARSTATQPATPAESTKPATPTNQQSAKSPTTPATPATQPATPAESTKPATPTNQQSATPVKPPFLNEIKRLRKPAQSPARSPDESTAESSARSTAESNTQSATPVKPPFLNQIKRLRKPAQSPDESATTDESPAESSARSTAESNTQSATPVKPPFLNQIKRLRKPAQSPARSPDESTAESATQPATPATPATPAKSPAKSPATPDESTAESATQPATPARSTAESATTARSPAESAKPAKRNITEHMKQRRQHLDTSSDDDEGSDSSAMSVIDLESDDTSNTKLTSKLLSATLILKKRKTYQYQYRKEDLLSLIELHQLEKVNNGQVNLQDYNEHLGKYIVQKAELLSYIRPKLDPKMKIQELSDSYSLSDSICALVDSDDFNDRNSLIDYIIKTLLGQTKSDETLIKLHKLLQILIYGYIGMILTILQDAKFGTPNDDKMKKLIRTYVNNNKPSNLGTASIVTTVFTNLITGKSITNSILNFGKTSTDGKTSNSIGFLYILVKFTNTLLAKCLSETTKAIDDIIDEMLEDTSKE